MSCTGIVETEYNPALFEFANLILGIVIDDDDDDDDMEDCCCDDDDGDANAIIMLSALELFLRLSIQLLSLSSLLI
jgi:hypothetical protein